MAVVNDVKFEVKVNVGITQDTADRCCQLLGMYLSDNPNKTLLVIGDDNDKAVIIEERSADNG